ncbi:glutamate-cysteine ligase [Thiobaca trueperi]|uniref:Glutamate--cysteine ligase n=1 Tax=Thiobaca trueperi TaxID=127458 RepID=A0A4R3MT78_9GAMM|nr:glutamate-cysteine ligase [Thiobaca trueperi]
MADLAAAGASATLAGNRIGLEKEGLRVTPAARLADSPHPPALGSALTHPYITTDFSESLIELVTPALTGAQEVLDFLTDIHRYVYRHLGNEWLWATSMPCVLERAGQIPLARYGASNAATMKTAYRRGLGNRYGRTMQMIAGVHFNFSFADAFWTLYQEQTGTPGEARAFRDAAQMGMIRNLQRIGWILPYLFGASPAVCASFVQGRATDLQHFDASTLFYPYATSLRMGDIGYQNKQEEGVGIKANYDSLDAYVRSLTWAIQTPCPRYEAIGVKVGDRYEQLNANVLQIENEYYSTVRPKQITDWLEKPSLALRRRGIAYVELRSLDVNLFEPVGVGIEQLLFLEVLMLDCLLRDSPRIGTRERRDIDENQVLAAHRGREPGLRLARDHTELELRQWAHELLDGMVATAALLDGVADGPRAANLRVQMEKIAHPDLTPSAQMLQRMRERGEGFFAFAQHLSEAHGRALRSSTLSAERLASFDRLAAESVQRQREIEASDDRSFDDFLRDYFAQGKAGNPSEPRV